MSINIVAGSWDGSAAGASVDPVIPASPQLEDWHILYVAAKSFNTVFTTPNGWTIIPNTDGTNGTVAAGSDVGSIHQCAYKRKWQPGDPTTVSVVFSSGDVGGGLIVRVRPTAGSTIADDDIVGEKGSDISSGTVYSATMASDIGITIGDAIIAFTSIAGNNSSFGTPTLSATGVNFGTVTETPATEFSTSSGTDFGASASTALPSAGPSSAAAVVGWTLSVAQTGMSALIRIRETSNIDILLDLVTYSSTINDLSILENELILLDLVTYSSTINDIVFVEVGNIDLDLVNYSSVINDINILENELVLLDLVTQMSVINDINILESELVLLDLVTYSSTINDLSILENELVLLDLVIYSSVINDINILESELFLLDLVTYSITINDISLLEDSDISLDLVIYSITIYDINIIENESIFLDLATYSSLINDISLIENEITSLDSVEFYSSFYDIAFVDLSEIYVTPAIRCYEIMEEKREYIIESEERSINIVSEKRNILIY